MKGLWTLVGNGGGVTQVPSRGFTVTKSKRARKSSGMAGERCINICRGSGTSRYFKDGQEIKGKSQRTSSLKSKDAKAKI